jgi:hypothetical protein
VNNRPGRWCCSRSAPLLRRLSAPPHRRNDS